MIFKKKIYTIYIYIRINIYIIQHKTPSNDICILYILLCYLLVSNYIVLQLLLLDVYTCFYQF